MMMSVLTLLAVAAFLAAVALAGDADPEISLLYHGEEFYG